jgi:hypothetical protein
MGAAVGAGERLQPTSIVIDNKIIIHRLRIISAPSISAQVPGTSVPRGSSWFRSQAPSEGAGHPNLFFVPLPW